MKAFFKAIRDSDFSKVKDYITKKPELINCVAKQPPKKDDGQSPLQVAYKTANFEIANYLIDQGANVNYIETESINSWNAPIIHDAIRACVFNSRYSVTLDIIKVEDGTFKSVMGPETSKEDFTIAINSLKKLIENHVEINAKDSYGGSSFMRLIMDINQTTDVKRHTPELAEDLDELIQLLFSNGLKVADEDKEDAKEDYSELLSLLNMEI